jgi:hypothetical protein
MCPDKTKLKSLKYMGKKNNEEGGQWRIRTNAELQ